MFKFYVAVAISVFACIAYSFTASGSGDKEKDDEYIKRQLILFLTIFVLTYCVSTLVYDGGMGKSTVGQNGSVYRGGNGSFGMDDLLENVELGEPPF